jgi:hypothetical protein
MEDVELAGDGSVDVAKLLAPSNEGLGHAEYRHSGLLGSRRL